MNIGVDIEDIARFENKSQKFCDKIFTKAEQLYCNSQSKSAQHYAVRFCAKEAVIKALSGFSIKNIYLCDIEIHHDKNECSQVKILKKLNKNLEIKISLSHDKTKAVAFVTAEEC